MLKAEFKQHKTQLNLINWQLGSQAHVDVSMLLHYMNYKYILCRQHCNKMSAVMKIVLNISTFETIELFRTSSIMTSLVCTATGYNRFINTITKMLVFLFSRLLTLKIKNIKTSCASCLHPARWQAKELSLANPPFTSCLGGGIHQTNSAVTL